MNTICPYCQKREVEGSIKNFHFYFCSICFEKMFGFSLKEYDEMDDTDELKCKMLNNYKSNRSFINIIYGGEYFYKHGKLDYPHTKE